ncbi:MAG: class II aldolase/adducin family protein [Thermosphaera sp.]
MYDDLKRQIVDVFRYIEEKGWNYGRAGNISIYIRKENRVLITPSGVPKSKLKPEEILVLDAEGNVIEGVGKPTIELPMHLAIFMLPSTKSYLGELIWSMVNPLAWIP